MVDTTKHLGFLLLFLLIQIWLVLLSLSEYCERHVYPSRNVMIWRSVLSRCSMCVANMPASVTLHLLLLATHGSPAHTSHLRGWELFSHGHYYFFLFCDEKDNHGFLKYVCAQLSINLATFLALEIIFATHSDLFVVCSDSGEKYLVLTYVTRTLDLFFSSPLCYVGRLSVFFFLFI